MKVTPGDVPTIPNALTATGMTMVLHGSQKLDTSTGIAEVAVGRIFDLADGAVARATGQTSELGAAFDAISDKICAATIIASEWRKGIAPKAALTAILAQNGLNAAITTVAAKRNPDKEQHSTKDGKYATAAQHIALSAYAMSHFLNEKGHSRTSVAAKYVGHAATVLGVGYWGAKATYTYAQRLNKS